MSLIYGRAWNTVIWLGDEPEDGAPSTLRGLHEATQYRDDILLEEERERLRHPPTEDPEAFKQLVSLLGRPWFRRTWIIQEVVLSLSPYIMIGQSSSPWEDFAGCCQSLRGLGLFEEIASRLTTTPAMTMHTPLSAVELVGLLWDKRTEYMTLHAKPDLFSTLVATRHGEFTNPLDKVYGILGFCDHEIIPDYSRTTAELFIEVTAKSLSKDLEFLEQRRAAADSDLRMSYQAAFKVFCTVDHEQIDPDLPSWVPDWSRPRVTTSLAFSTSALSIYNAGGAFRADAVSFNRQDRRLTIKESSSTP